MCCTNSFFEYNYKLHTHDYLQLNQMQSFYYLFDINIQRVFINISFPCTLQVRLKKGKSPSQTKSFKIQQPIHFIDINDSITLKLKGRLNQGKFQPQQAKMQVLLFLQNSSEVKLAGQIQKLDLTQLINPERKRESSQKMFEMPLSKSTPSAKIQFTVYCQYLMDCQNQESIADVSFQNHSSSPFNISTTDMTFRPPKENNLSDHRRTTSRQNEQANKQSKSPLLPRNDSRPQYRQQRINSREVKENSGYRQSVKYQNREAKTYPEIKVQAKNQRPQNSYIRIEQPLGFSFGPQVAPDRDKQVKQLLQHLNETNRQLSDKKRECERLQTAVRAAENERGGIDDKKLQLINELNSSVAQLDQLKRERSEMINQIGKYKQEMKQLESTVNKLKDENRQLTNNFNRMRDQSSRQIQQINQRNQLKRKQFEQLKLKFEKLMRDNEEMKDDLFRKQSQLISSQNHAQQIKTQYLNKSIPIMQELKRVNQDLGRQKEQLERRFGQLKNQFNEQKQLRSQAEKKWLMVNDQLQKQKQNRKALIQAFQNKQKQNQQHLAALQQQMSHLFGEETAQKDHQIQELKKKIIQQTKRADQEKKRADIFQKEKESLQIQISQLKVRIQHLQKTCVNLERDYTQKQKEVAQRDKQNIQKAEFIEKVRAYVAKIEAENEQKAVAIRQRDEFIAKAKQFISTRQRELLVEIERIKKDSQGVSRGQIQKLKADISNLTMQASKRQTFIGGLVQEGNMLQQRLEEAESRMQLSQHRANELEDYAGHLQQRLEISQQQMQQLVLKTRSQEQTLGSMVKKQLEMDMQINVLRFKLGSLSSGRNS